MSKPKLILGSSQDPTHGLAALKANSIHHFITDPPYDAHTHEKMMRATKDGSVAKFAPVAYDAITEEQMAWYATQMVRVSRGWVIIFCASEDVGTWQHHLVLAGAKWRGAHIWLKKGGGTPKFRGDGPGKGYESFCLAWAGRGNSKWNAGGRAGVYLHAPEPNWKVQGQKPKRLMTQMLLDFTKPRQRICDPFMGAGTTGVAARALGRRFLGYEVNPAHFAIAEERIAETREQTHLEQHLHHRKVRDSAYGKKPEPKINGASQLPLAISNRRKPQLV